MIFALTRVVRIQIKFSLAIQRSGILVNKLNASSHQTYLKISEFEGEQACVPNHIYVRKSK